MWRITSSCWAASRRASVLPAASRRSARYFTLARGVAHEHADGMDCCGAAKHSGTAALEMTKWFDTNYHYLVPEFGPDTEFTLAPGACWPKWRRRRRSATVKAALLGPLTFLWLGKAKSAGTSTAGPARRLLPAY
jgi:5-methyltetrahydropteroyltriglutamate--homocysteine methyltransferase